jgi:hypothetical protein
MACTCISQINASPEMREANIELALVFTLTGDCIVEIKTVKVNKDKRGRRERVVATFCPFCGKRYGKARKE